MANRITRNIAEINLGHVNKLLDEIGSSYRLGIEHPWSHDFLGLTTKDANGTWIKTYSQCGFREINDTASMLYDFLYYLKQEKVFKNE